MRELKHYLKENALQGKPLCVMDDMVFKAMLSSDNEDSREALRSLLSACTRREISNVRVMNGELFPAHLDAKSARLDVNVTFNDGESADLEMQMGKSADDIKDRAAYYTAMLLSGQSEKGQPYKEIKRVYQIFFLNFVLFPQSEKLPRRYRYMEESEHDCLTKSTEIIFYELPKLEKQVKDYFEDRAESKGLPEDEKWCIFMKYRHEKQAGPIIEDLCRKEEGIMHAEKSLEKIYRSYDKYYRKMSIAKNNVDMFYKMKNAREEARADEKLQIARNLLTEGSTPEFVQKITGLDLETISELRN